MRWYYKWRRRLVSFFKRTSADDELALEIEQHVEMVAAAYEAEGLPPDIARKKALREFGNVEALKEECRDSWGMRLLWQSLRDIKLGGRLIVKDKSFSIPVIATLALCIGVNTAIFSVLYSLILRPLPFESPENIIQVFNVFKDYRPKASQAGWNQYQDFRNNASLFEGFALTSPVEKVLGSTQVKGLAVSSDYCELLRIKPIAGRFFTPEERTTDGEKLIVLTQTFWEKRFDADPDIVGKSVRFLNDNDYSIIGVLPRSVEVFDSRIQFLIPLKIIPKNVGPQLRQESETNLWSRLKPGVSIEAGTKQLNQLEKTWAEEVANPINRQRFEFSEHRLELGRPHPLKGRLWLLQTGALLVLIVGSVNVTNLHLCRASRRSQELSMRHSLGASLGVLVRMMLWESLVLGVLGLTIGWAVAQGSIYATNKYLPIIDPTASPIVLDQAIVAWGVSITLLLVLVMGLFPLLLLWGANRIKHSQALSKNVSAGPITRRVGVGLAIIQIAISCALLIAALLLFQSLQNVLRVDPGFDAPQIVTGEVRLGKAFPDSTTWKSIRKQILESVGELPGVEQVSFSFRVAQLLGWGGFSHVAIRGRPSESGSNPAYAVCRFVGANYFSTMGIPLLEGRYFFQGESEFKYPGYTGDRTYIVGESFVNRYLKESNQILGTEISTRYEYLETPSKESFGRIVGVVGRVNFEGQDARDKYPVLYSSFDGDILPRFWILVRTKRPSESVILEIRETLKTFSPELHLYDATSLSASLDNLNLERKGMTFLIGAFAVLAVFLCSIGIYGVLSYDVELRQREIGIRSAIGASRIDVMGMVLRQGLVKTVVGLVAGLIAALYSTRFLESRLFDITPLDPLTYISVPTFLFLVSVLASYIPTRRAVKINPTDALRAD